MSLNSAVISMNNARALVSFKHFVAETQAAKKMQENKLDVAKKGNAMMDVQKSLFLD